MPYTTWYDTGTNEQTDDDEDKYEVYWFDESIGSERIRTFRTAQAAEKYCNSLPQHKMAHWS
jgi:hypothetical protein